MHQGASDAHIQQAPRAGVFGSGLHLGVAEAGWAEQDRATLPPSLAEDAYLIEPDRAVQRDVSVACEQPGQRHVWIVVPREPNAADLRPSERKGVECGSLDERAPLPAVQAEGTGPDE